MHIAEKIEFTQNSANSWIAPKSSRKVQTEKIPAHRHSWPRNWTQNIQKSSKTWLHTPKIRTKAKANTETPAILQLYVKSAEVESYTDRIVCDVIPRAIDGWKDGINKPEWVVKLGTAPREIGHHPLAKSRNRAPPTSKRHQCNPIILTKRAWKHKVAKCQKFHTSCGQRWNYRQVYEEFV